MWGYQLGTSHLVEVGCLLLGGVNRGFTVSIMFKKTN